jgi:hypothetical protein
LWRLDADTGKLKGHYQFTPHDEFDWDSVQVPVLADIEWQGRPRKLILWANRKRILLRPRPHQRAIPAREGFRQAELERCFDEYGPPDEIAGA